MNVVVKHEQFLNALELVSRTSTKHATLPALSCVLLDAQEKTLTLYATNLDVAVEATVPADVAASGKVAVAAHTLLSLSHLATHSHTTLSLRENALSLENGGSQATITTVESGDMPTLKKLEGEGHTIHPERFALGIKTAAFAASASTIKPELGSVYIHQKQEDTLTFVATDSFRLVEKTVPQEGVVLNSPLLFPAKNALEVARVLEASKEPPHLLVSDNQCAFSFADKYLTSRLIGGTFPDYEQIIPKEYTLNATVLRADLLQALKKTNIFLNKFMQLTVATKASHLVLSAHSGEIGTTREQLNASIEGEELELNFNHRYLADILPHITDESVTLRFAGVGRPLVLQGVHDTTLRYLVMPMNR